MIKVGVGPSGIPTVTAPNSGPTIAAYIRGVKERGYDSIAVGDHLDERGPRC